MPASDLEPLGTLIATTVARCSADAVDHPGPLCWRLCSNTAVEAPVDGIVEQVLAIAGDTLRVAAPSAVLQPAAAPTVRLAPEEHADVRAP